MPALRRTVGAAVLRVAAIALLPGLGACALFAPPGQTYVVYFEPSSADLNDPAKAVLASAAGWAQRHPDLPVVVASYTDPYGSAKANADFTRMRAQLVIDRLVAGGVAAGRIRQRDVGSVGFALDSQESRRVVITVGAPPARV